MNDYKLADLFGIAGATIGIIIAAAILLGTVNAKYVVVFDRYRQLATERRDGPKESRTRNIKLELSIYRTRIRQLNLGSLLVQGALVTFIVAVCVAAASVMFPKQLLLRTGGTAALFAGLTLLLVATVLHMLETWRERSALVHEVADMDVDHEQK